MWMTFRRLLCFRHNFIVSAESKTMFLRCMHCGHRTVGWKLDARAEVVVNQASRSGRQLPGRSSFARI
jgi:hypothetical protein